MAQEDKFANYAIITVTESAANTLTFKKLETGISLNEKVAWVLNRVEYLVSGLTATNFNASNDYFNWGLSLSNAWSNPNIDENTIVDYNSVIRLDFGAAASGRFLFSPIIKDFSSLPGGGVLVPPTPFYLYAQGNGLVGALTVTSRIHYTLKQLKVDEYWELVEARRVLSS